ncbi:MAG: PAS domain S-box protein, partial [Synechococcaceae cyanobacterium SM2_3_1]|nr:PAS domain S-box protein [Synechococcaceae cyanobacterium SM2_3_1]
MRLNRRWETVLGHHLEELENQPFLDLVHPEDREDTLNALEKLARQEEITNFTNRFRCRDGSYRWLEWASVSVGQIIYAAARDITERYEAECRLQESEARLRLFIDSLPFPVWARDSQYRLVLQNRADQEMFGDLIGKTLDESTLPDRTLYHWNELLKKIDSGDILREQTEERIKGVN